MFDIVINSPLDILTPKILQQQMCDCWTIFLLMWKCCQFPAWSRLANETGDLFNIAKQSQQKKKTVTKPADIRNYTIWLQSMFIDRILKWHTMSCRNYGTPHHFAIEATLH